VQLFLVTQAQVVSLEDAARLLLGECKESAKLKTKVRRLYDIANILSSLNLIEKTHNTENRKPAFKWLGVKDNAKYTAEMATKKRQFGTVLSTNTNTTSVPKAKRGRPSSKDGFESHNQPLNGAKASSVLKPLQPKCTNVAGAVYNPVPVYPREGSAIPMPGMAASAPGVPTSLTLGTSGGGWREWTTADSHRVSEQKGNDSAGAAAGSSPSLKPSNLTGPGFPSRNRDYSAGFSFGPFCPFRLQQQCLASIYPAQGFDRVNERRDENQDREGSSQESEVTNPFPLQYQNEAMDQIFAHCMNAWKSWYLQAAVSATANATSASSPVPSGHEPSDSVTEAT
jgi:transcription factor E2F7/8